jgi:GntR family transcriptional regulator, transcriptional repressor for pyruvate dehydrogenase complex
LKTFEKLNIPSAYQVVTRELRRMILAGDLKAGAQFPTEAKLAGQFGVNRSTVREGIRQLENEGLVSREGRKRLTVSIPGSEKLSSQATRALVMRQVTFRELWEVSLVLEPACAAMCAQHSGDELKAAIETNLQCTRDEFSDIHRCTELDTEFHALVARGSDNKALLLSREPVGLLLFPAFDILSPLLPQAIGRMLEAHAHIGQAILSANAADAEMWMRKHIVDFRRGWEMSKLSLDLPIELPRALADT